MDRFGEHHFDVIERPGNQPAVPPRSVIFIRFDAGVIDMNYWHAAPFGDLSCPRLVRPVRPARSINGQDHAIASFNLLNQQRKSARIFLSPAPPNPQPHILAPLHRWIHVRIGLDQQGSIVAKISCAGSKPRYQEGQVAVPQADHRGLSQELLSTKKRLLYCGGCNHKFCRQAEEGRDGRGQRTVNEGRERCECLEEAHDWLAVGVGGASGVRVLLPLLLSLVNPVQCLAGFSVREGGGKEARNG